MTLFELITVLGAFGALASYLIQLVDSIRRKKRQGEATTEDRVKRLTKSLEESVALIGSIETEIKARAELAKQLKQDIDQYNKLVELKKPEVDAIAQLLRGELAREGRASFWKGFAINFLFFVLGAGASLIITMWMK